jgi:hypothetical protein
MNFCTFSKKMGMGIKNRSCLLFIMMKKSWLCDNLQHLTGIWHC